MMPVDGHLRRIEREAGVPGLAEALAELAPTDLKSLLLHVFERQAARRDPATLLAQYERDGDASPPARSNARARRAALRAAEGFEPVALAPVSPLGPQRRARPDRPEQRALDDPHTEVLADPTAALALEAAVRRRRGEDETVRLCALCRVLRLQPIPDVPGFTPHFAALRARHAPGARSRRHGFEIEALREHVAVYRRCSTRSASRTPSCGSPRCPRVLEAIPGAVEDPARTPARGYYDGHAADLAATDGDGVTSARGRWPDRLDAAAAVNRKERLLTSGIGLGLLAQRFTWNWHDIC